MYCCHVCDLANTHAVVRPSGRQMIDVETFFGTEPAYNPDADHLMFMPSAFTDGALWRDQYGNVQTAGTCILKYLLHLLVRIVINGLCNLPICTCFLRTPTCKCFYELYVQVGSHYNVVSGVLCI